MISSELKLIFVFFLFNSISKFLRLQSFKSNLEKLITSVQPCTQMLIFAQARCRFHFQELFQVRNHRDYLSCVTISESLGSAASCGDSSIRIHDIRELTEVTAIINVEDEPKGLRDIAWTDDGQLLAVSAAKGNLHCYLTKLPMLGDTNGTR